MDIKEYIKKNFKISKFNESDIYVTNDNNEYYVTHVNLSSSEWLIKFCAEKELTNFYSTGGPKRTINVAYSPIDNKWYGWSHRALFGFTIGSKVKKGHVAYNPSNKEDYIDSMLNFWKDEDTENIRIENITENGFDVVWEYSNKIKNEKLRGKTHYKHEVFPKIFGKGEWIAKTMEDARQMAIDFAENIG